MNSFKVSVKMRGEVLLGRWLCLDSLLDAALELRGVEGEERHLPLAAWDGADIHQPGSYGLDNIRSGKMCYLASAAFVKDPVHTERTLVKTCRAMHYRDHIPIRNNRGNYINGIDMQRDIAVNILDKIAPVSTPMLSWYGTGDLDAICDLLNSLPGIGAKVAQGFGQHEGVSDRETLDEGRKLLGILDPSGSLARPISADLFRSLGVNAGRSEIETTEPPYWNAKNARPAFVPVASKISGLLVA